MILKYLLNTLSICGLFCLFATPIVASAASTVMVKDAGKVDAGKVVSPQNFVEANKLVTSEVVCLRIDMIDMKSKVEVTESDPYIFTDAELKILDGEGNLLYFATTLYEDIEEYHGSDGTYDENCKIYYYVSGKHHNSAPGGCSNPKQKYTLDKDPDNDPTTEEGSSIGGKERNEGKNGKIIAIEFYPNLSGDLTISGITRKIRDIVLNPNNTIIVSRKGDLAIERDVDGNRIWRPVTIQYYTIPLSNGD